MNEKTLRVLEYKKIIGLLAKHTVSNLGKEIALDLKPSKNIYQVKEWLQETSEAVDILLKKGSVPLQGIYDIRMAVDKSVKGFILENKELLNISDTLAAARKIKDYLKDEKKNNQYPIIEDLISLLSVFKDLEDMINNTIINEDDISDKASPELYSVRKKIQGKHISIKEKLNNMLSSASYQKYLQEQIITLRGDRYVLPIKQEFRGNIQGIVHDQSSSGATLYIEPMPIVELNNELKQLKLREDEEINKILLMLSEAVSIKSQEIKTNIEILGTLDFIFAKAKFSLELDCFEPIINDLARINLKKARHPLIDKNIVVPIDVNLGDKFNILVITGPNTGGKTVSLKTIGLLILMSQSGLHIPTSDRSEICIFDKVFADIGDEQSIEQSLSTFSSHMKNIISILDNINKDSLVLLDELGAGTDPTEGAALAMSILELLRIKKIRSIATTHYSELKAYALITPGICNGSVEFDIETLKPTYKLSIGAPGKSNAFEISKKLGLSDSIIERARDFITKDKIKFEDIITGLEESKKKAKEERDIAEALRYDAEIIKKEADEKLNKVMLQRQKIIKKAHDEARTIMDRQKMEIYKLIKELKEAVDKETKEKLKTINNARTVVNRIEFEMDKNRSDINYDSKISHTPPKNLKVGDLVRIVKINQKGYVLSEADENGDLMVQAGIMKINVNINDLQYISENDNEVAFKTRYSGIAKEKTFNVAMELDVRGRSLDEALLEVDKYLDDVYLSRRSKVTLIHGKGTGVLREGIIQLLKGHPHVKSYRAGAYNEGGIGATIVEINE